MKIKKIKENINYIDQKIVEMATQKKLIKTINTWVVKECPDIDEIVCLTRVISVLKGNDFEVNYQQIKVAFKMYYNEENHGDSRSYLKWLRNDVCPSKKLAIHRSKMRQTSEKTIGKEKTVVTTPEKEKNSLEEWIVGKKWKCPSCKRERKYEEPLKMKICSCCVVEMEVVNG